MSKQRALELAVEYCKSQENIMNVTEFAKEYEEFLKENKEPVSSYTNEDYEMLVGEVQELRHKTEKMKKDAANFEIALKRTLEKLYVDGAITKTVPIFDVLNRFMREMEK